MKIAFVAQPTDVLPSERGGSIGIWIDAVARRLAASHQVAVYSARAPSQPGEERLDGVRHVRVAVDRDTRGVDLLERLERAIGRLAGSPPELFYRYYYFARRYYAHYVASVARCLADDDAEVVAVPNFAQFLPALKRASPRKRFVLNMHCDWLVEHDEERVSPWLAPADAVSGCSRYVSDGIAARFPGLAERCRPVYSASDPERFAPLPAGAREVEALREKLGLGEARVVLFTGRICPEKGVDVLLEAFGRVAAADPGAALVVVGGLSQQPPSPRWVFHRDPAYARFDAERAAYPARLDALRDALGDRVRMVGRVPHAELRAYYALAQVCVHPAVWREPFGMILTEAMLCERAVVSSRTGGIVEIVEEGETGLLAEPGDPVGLAAAILELLADPGRCAEMGARGRQRVLDTFTWEHSTRQLEALLSLACAGAAGA